VDRYGFAAKQIHRVIGSCRTALICRPRRTHLPALSLVSALPQTSIEVSEPL
jgi:hypothetical protein